MGGDFDEPPVLDNRHKSPSYADFHPMPVVADVDGNVVSPSKKHKLTTAEYEKMSVSELGELEDAGLLTLTVTKKHFDEPPVLDNRHKSPSYADFHPMPVVTDFDGNVVSPSKKHKLTAADYEKMSVSEMNAAAGLTLTVTRK